MPFAGAKLAILIEGCVLTILRDDRPDIPFPNCWDLPGGGRERDETPVECVLRETHEEISLPIAQSAISWGSIHGDDDCRTWFFVTKGQEDWLSQIRLGDEGQRWSAMPVDLFLNHPRGIPHFQERLCIYLRDQKAACHT